MKRKILHIISGLKDGGAEGVLYRIINSNNEDLEHVVVCLTNGGKYNKLISDAKIKIKNLNITNYFNFVTAFVSLCIFLNKEKPNVVQTWMYHSDVIGGLAAYFLGVKKIYWNLRSAEFHKDQKITTKIFIKISAFLSNVIPNSIITCSERAIIIHKKIGYKSDFFLIDNGIDTKKFLPSVKKKLNIRQNLEINSNCTLIGMVARYDPQKDHLNLLKAISKTNNYNFKILLVGYGIDYKNKKLLYLINQFNLTDRIILYGQSSNIHEIMCGIDFLVLPSSYGEAFPNVIIEAMSVGTPCIVTDVGDSKRIVGNLGWTIPPNSPEELRKAIISAINIKTQNYSKYVSLSKKCVYRVDQNFKLEKMISKYENLWMT
tara:strand:+ start:1354 stop:2475 length:1122 start_codon:yes stop_codon:yes gene_type:complete